MVFFKKRVSDPLEELRKEASGTMRIESIFKHGERIPDKYTCDGEDISPPIRISGVPEKTVELVLIMYDPDAPIGTFYHWLLYSIPPEIAEIPEGVPRDKVTAYGVQGINDFGDYGYGGPCPPHGHGTHRYFFVVVALSERTELEPGADIDSLMDRIRGKTLSYGVLMGTYSR